MSGAAAGCVAGLLWALWQLQVYLKAAGQCWRQWQLQVEPRAEHAFFCLLFALLHPALPHSELDMHGSAFLMHCCTLPPSAVSWTCMACHRHWSLMPLSLRALDQQLVHPAAGDDWPVTGIRTQRYQQWGNKCSAAALFNAGQRRRCSTGGVLCHQVCRGMSCWRFCLPLCP